MAEDSNQFPIKIMTLSIEILTILYSRDLTHEELVQYRKRFNDYFDDLKKSQFPNYPIESIQHMEQKIKNEMLQFNEQMEKERKERIASMNERMCCVCQSRTDKYRAGENPEEFYCIPCSLKYLKGESNTGMLEQPVN